MNKKGYELKCKVAQESFRPQQGLTIMNQSIERLKEQERRRSFRPQQGLTIMNVKNGKVIKTINGSFPSPTGVNYYELNDNFSGKYYIDGFRPQQGLTIMNSKK